MEVGNISRNRQTGESLSSSSVADIRRDATYDLHALCPSGIHNGAAAHSVDCHSVDQIGMPPFLASADIAREKAKGGPQFKFKVWLIAMAFASVTYIYFKFKYGTRNKP